MTTHVSLCRPGSEAWLAQELRAAGQAVPAPDSGGERPDALAPDVPPAGGTGWLAWRPVPPAQGRAPRAPAPDALIFERQRLADAHYLAGTALEALATALAGAARQALAGQTGGVPRAALSLHVFAPDPTGESSGSGRAARLERLLRAAWGGQPPALRDPLAGRADAGDAARERPVWQVCLLADGAWWALGPAGALVDPYPGGVHRMERDAGAPSRSYLKIEEALEVLGRMPRARERVIDLGAAPGGWSYAFLQRGCRVLAVDNGPLRLPDLEALPGELTHLRADGLRLRPPPGWLPADWLLSDMLIAPGVCLGLLRKWIEAGWMRRFIVNVKLPQREPLVALGPLREYLAGVPALAWRMRQLYHDRREVTVLGELSAQRPAVAVPATPPRRRPAPDRGAGQPAPRRPGRPPQRPPHRPARRRPSTRRG